MESNNPRLGRRAFLTRGALAAAAVTAAVVVPSQAGEWLADNDAADPMAATDVDAGRPMVAFVQDAARGEVVVMAGVDEVIIRDHDLVTRLLRAQAALGATT